ncbi:MAG: hypothetical protein FJZ01_22365, partial [Candidatus Sericytochromatia bacterium]|nr:hypothetical protein [Candidatus Tanganyikabacteria bacterium]
MAARKLTFVAAILAATLVVSQALAATDDDVRRLKKGMSVGDVIGVMGNAATTLKSDRDGAVEELIYGPRGGVQFSLKFAGGKLVSAVNLITGRDELMLAAATPVPVAVATA